MLDNIVVTGASGLLGSNICRIAAQEGRKVVGMVRKETDAEVLRSIGVQPVIGDILDASRLEHAFEGADGVIHCAAVIGGTWSTATRAEFDAVNHHGVVNVLTHGEKAGVEKTVLINSMVICDMRKTVTESSPLVPLTPNANGYLQSKLASYYHGMYQAARGQHVTFVLPAGMYGPSPFVDRALDPTLFTGTLLMAITGELKAYAHFPIAWPYVDDTARICLAALDKGADGVRYLAGGRPEDVCSLAEFCNIACEEAGVDHRVEDLHPSAAADEIGSMKALAETTFASPLLDPSMTTHKLGVELTPLQTGIARTVRWLRRQGRI